MAVDRRTLSLVVLALLAVAASLRYSPGTVLDPIEQVADRPLLFFAVVVGLYTVRPAVLWPTTLVAVVVGFGYGVSVGLPLALAGAVYTSIAPFYIARWLGRDAPGIARLQAAGEQFFDATGDFRGVVAGRLAPVPADAVTCAAAIAGVRFRTFVAGVLVGELPWTVGAVLVGASLSTLSAEGLGAFGTRLAIVTGIGAALLLAGPLYSLAADREGSVPQ